MSIKSPITGSSNTILDRSIPTSYIIDAYKKKLGINVEKFFKSISTIEIYKCLDTSYRFYHPFNITGDDSFYQELEKFPWYYMDWKWEHKIASEIIKKGDRVLEIGCAHGSFLKKIKDGGAIVEGLELNSGAMNDCLKNKLLVYSDTIEKFSEAKKNIYDVVCSFEVLEHVAEVKSFIDSSLYALKPGGLMVVSVPNNDCLMFKYGDGTLNIPPHHMGLWTMNSLIKLQEYFPMKIESIHLEPLQKYHIGFAQRLSDRKVTEKLLEKFSFFAKFIEPIAKRLATLGVISVSEHIIGHTILAVFKKND